MHLWRLENYNHVYMYTFVLGRINCADGVLVSLKDIFTIFDECRALEGKPKLFFIQACRSTPGKILSHLKIRIH